jgi:hypothetical protein
MYNKSKKYKEAIHWIANNDEVTIFDIEELSSLLTVTLIADLFKLSPEDVAEDVIKARKDPTSKIASYMFVLGVDKDLIEDAVHYSKTFEGIFELMLLWDRERDRKEALNILETLSKTIADIKREETFDRIKQTYYACDTCLQSAGGKPIPGHIFTASEGTCEVCWKENVTLIPWTDMNWKDARRNAIAKANRD